MFLGLCVLPASGVCHGHNIGEQPELFRAQDFLRAQGMVEDDQLASNSLLASSNF